MILGAGQRAEYFSRMLPRLLESVFFFFSSFSMEHQENEEEPTLEKPTSPPSTLSAVEFASTFSSSSAKGLARAFGWKMGVFSPSAFSTALVTNPSSFRVLAAIQSIWGPKMGDAVFPFIKTVRNRVVSYLEAIRDEKSLPVLDPKNLKAAGLLFLPPFSQAYHVPLLKDPFIRIDMIKGNFSALCFSGVLPPHLTTSYSDFLSSFIVPSDILNPTPENLSLASLLLSEAKSIRQSTFGIVFKASLNKIVVSLLTSSVAALLSSSLWLGEGEIVEGKGGLSLDLQLDSASSDEVVFSTRRSLSLETLKSHTLSISQFYSTLRLPSIFRKNNEEDEGKESKSYAMTPVRVELAQLSLLESKLTSHPALLNGSSAIIESVLFTTDPSKQRRKREMEGQSPVGNERKEAGVVEKRLKLVPKELHRLFYKKLHGMEFIDDDFLVEHDGMTCRILDDVF